MLVVRQNIWRKEKMQNIKSKTMAIMIALLLTISMGSTLMMPTASAHTPPWIITPVAYAFATPTPIGVGQTGEIFGWLNYAISGTLITNNIRFHNYHFIVTAPDGTVQTFDFPYVADSTSSQPFTYTPTQAGTYNITFLFPGQTYDFGGQYQGDYYTPANASYLWTVQEQQVGALSQNPLPTEYWARPINQEQNINNAMTIGSNWLGGDSQSSGLMTLPASYIQYNGAAPLTPHVMWTKPVEFGGALGGQIQQPQQAADTPGAYYSGMAYNIRFTNPMIVNGILYYQKPLGYSGSGGGEVAVDLQTGETVWTNDNIFPTFATIINFQTPNGYGPGGAQLWQISGSTWLGYNAFDGKNVFNITSVPSGTTVRFNDGNIGKYQFSYNTVTKTGWLALWNVSRLISGNSDTWSGPNRSFAGNSSTAYSWNVTITADLTGDTNPTIIGVVPGSEILGASSSLATVSQPNPNHDPWTIWALSDNPATEGNLTWIKHYAAPPFNQTQMFATQPIDPTTLTFAMTIAETGQRLGYSLTTGEKLWGPLGVQPGFQYYSSREGVPYMGVLYVSGLGGEVQAYSMTNGTLLWTYGNGGVAGNSTEMANNGPWGLYPTHVAVFAAGVLYTFSGEHSPTNPLYNGELTRALNATTGAEIWTLLDWSGCGLGNSMQSFPVADGYGVMFNCYDSQIYVVGQGPSQLTVTAPNTATTVGVPLTIRGTITDISAGTKQNQQATNFPNGVPVVSDASMSEFMAALYEDQAMPNNVTGVPVIIYVLDSNGNYRPIGTVTSDANGMYSLTWMPDISGDFTVYAKFAGTQGYFGSSAETSFTAVNAPATPTPTAQPLTSVTDQYFVPAVAGIIVAIVIVGAALALLTLRKRA
jgi:hypothetical protein